MKNRLRGRCRLCLRGGLQDCREISTPAPLSRSSDVALTFKEVSFDVQLRGGQKKQILEAWRYGDALEPRSPAVNTACDASRLRRPSPDTTSPATWWPSWAPLAVASPPFWLLGISQSRRFLRHELHL